MNKINHKFKLTGNSTYNHFKKHHKKYVFGLLSTAAAYKLISLAITGFFANPGIHFSFAGDVIDPTPETEIIEEIDNTKEEQNIEEAEGNIEEEIENDEGEVPVTTEICKFGDIEIKSPLSGDILKGEIEIEIDYKKDECLDETFYIKLWDTNTQYVEIGKIQNGDSGITFDSSLLYSGFYNITGLNLDGEEILLYTGDYEGVNTKYFTGHKLIIFSNNMNILYEGDEFTIDNKEPTVFNVNLFTSGVNNGFIGLDNKIELNFDSNEELTGVVVNILGIDAELEESTGNQYKFSLVLSDENTEGNIIYNIEFEDLAGNTGYYEGSSNIVFDKSLPEIVNMNFSLSGNEIILEIDTEKLSKIIFVYSLSGNDQTKAYISPYQNSHKYTLSGLSENKYYKHTLSINNQAGKTIYLGGYFKWINNEVIFEQETILAEKMLVVASFTGDVNSGSLIDSLLVEIEKFNNCKASIKDFTNIKMPIGPYNIIIKMPNIEKYSVKKLVSAFSLVLFERMETAKLNEESLNEIKNNFNDFLVMLKLIQDDDNQCEQNLSNYYISKFRNNLIKYNLTID